MSEHVAGFREADQRLGAMHGYEPGLSLKEMLVRQSFERADRMEAKLDALETLVREIKHALSAGAVGRWT